MIVPGVPFDQGRNPHGRIVPTAIVAHRTYGRWKGDYSVGKNGRGGFGIGFHFLVGKSGTVGGTGNWVQFYDTTTKCWHAPNMNGCAVGIEVEGTDADAMTEWQVHAVAWILAVVCAAHGIPETYSVGGGRRQVRGIEPHSLVPGSTHTDHWTLDDWNRIDALLHPPVPLPPAAPPVPPPASSPPAEVPLALRDHGSAVAALQFKLKAISGQPTVVDGDYGPATYLAVTLFQRFMRLPETGAADLVTQATLDAAIAATRGR